MKIVTPSLVNIAFQAYHFLTSTLKTTNVQKLDVPGVQMKKPACVGCVHLLNFHLEAPFSRYI